MKPEQAEIDRRKKESAKLRMERDILKKPRPISPRSRCEVRLRGEAPRGLAGDDGVRGARCVSQRVPRVAGAAAQPTQPGRRGYRSAGPAEFCRR